MRRRTNARMIATDGVFSMDGEVAKLKEICDLAEKYDAVVMVDDSHATGFVGKSGRGTPEYCGAEGRVDIIPRRSAKRWVEPAAALRPGERKLSIIFASALDHIFFKHLGTGDCRNHP